VFVVALAELGGPAEAEAPLLAADLGCTAYDARLMLAGGLPAVVKTTADKAQAIELLGKLRARGHGAVACDTGAVASSGSMKTMKAFRLGADAIEEGGERLPYDDLVALVGAVHRSRTDSTTVSKEKKFSMSRALLTSGLSMSKTVTKETKASAEDRESVLYLFRKSGEAPWLLREHGTNWAGHGRALEATEAGNFKVTVALLREKAKGAQYDDRLVTRKVGERAALHGGSGTTTVKTSSEATMDLLAHVLAMWLARAGAYR